METFTSHTSKSMYNNAVFQVYSKIKHFIISCLLNQFASYLLHQILCLFYQLTMEKLIVHVIGKYQDSSATVVNQLPSSAVFRVILSTKLNSISHLLNQFVSYPLHQIFCIFYQMKLTQLTVGQCKH